MQLLSQNSGREVDTLRGGKSVQQPVSKAMGGPEHVVINLPIDSDPYKHQASQDVNSMGLTKSLSVSSAKNKLKSEKSDSFRKVF